MGANLRKEIRDWGGNLRASTGLGGKKGHSWVFGGTAEGKGVPRAGFPGGVPRFNCLSPTQRV